MFLGIATGYYYSRLFRETNFSDALDVVAELGFDGLELPHPASYIGAFGGTLHLTPDSIDDEGLLVEAAGLKVLSVNPRNDFVQPDNDVMKHEIEIAKMCIEAAVELDCDNVRLFGGERKERLDDEDCFKLLVKAFKQVSNCAEERNVKIAFENHGRLTSDYELQLRILEEVGSEALGLNLDTGNYYRYGYPLSEVHKILDVLAEKAYHVHLKGAKASADRKEEWRKYDEAKFVPIPDGDIDNDFLIKKLKSIGYDRTISIEDEPVDYHSYGLEDLKKLLKRDVEYVRPLVSR